MNKKLVWVLTLVLLAAGTFAEAQQPDKLPRIGYVSASGSANNPGPQIASFRQGLRDRDYIEGKNILVEYRYLEGKLDRIPTLMAELVQLKVDLFVLTSLPVIRRPSRRQSRFPFS